MSEIAVWRLYLLRAMYLLLVVGLGLFIWPGILAPGDNVSHMTGVVRSMLGALSLLALLGLRYPLQMLPLLLFELAWKVIWVVTFGLGPWLAGELDPPRQETLFECVFGIVVVLVTVPWDYVYRRYILAPGDPWRKRPAGAPTGG